MPSFPSTEGHIPCLKKILLLREYLPTFFRIPSALGLVALDRIQAELKPPALRIGARCRNRLFAGHRRQ